MCMCCQKAPNQNPFHFMNYQSGSRVYAASFQLEYRNLRAFKTNDRPARDLRKREYTYIRSHITHLYEGMHARINTWRYVTLPLSRQAKRNSIDSIYDVYAREDAKDDMVARSTKKKKRKALYSPLSINHINKLYPPCETGCTHSIQSAG